MESHEVRAQAERLSLAQLAVLAGVPLHAARRIQDRTAFIRRGEDGLYEWADAIRLRVSVEASFRIKNQDLAADAVRLAVGAWMESSPASQWLLMSAGAIRVVTAEDLPRLDADTLLSPAITLVSLSLAGQQR